MIRLMYPGTQGSGKKRFCTTLIPLYYIQIHRTITKSVKVGCCVIEDK